MLQIKKQGTLSYCKYNLLFTFQKKKASYEYGVTTTKTQLITLRSPKHFNIGKLKVYNLNFKTPNLIFYKEHVFCISTLFRSKDSLFRLFTRKIKTTPALLVSSVCVRVKTQFKLMWLET